MPVLNQDFAFSTISDTAEQIRTRQISPVEITEALLERIEKINPLLNAFVTLTADLAMEQAKKAELDIVSGNYKGPLHGIPIVHKDLYYTKGIRTTASSKILQDFVPDYDATVVEKLQDAGTILLGKVQTHEFAAGATTSSPHFAPCHNPWNLDRVPGGSSGGTGASVAAGLAFMGTGTDTGGSIRIPAACCGIVGMKPTYGRVSRYGIFPLAWSLDHAGPLTRSVKDAALCLQAMAGYDPRDESTAALPIPDFTAELREELKGVKIGIPVEHYFNGLDPEVEAAVKQAIQVFEELGAEVREVSLPMANYAHIAAMTVSRAEILSIHEDWFETRPEDYGHDVRMLIEAGKPVTAAQYLRAQRARHLITKDYISTMTQVDVLITPTLPIVAPRIEDSAKEGMKLISNNSPSNITGLPSLVLPCGFSSEGLPISLQIIGKPFDESKVLGVGYAYEQGTNWHNRRPDIQ
jgi:aspartyl-tRNA(Asn)/glutamyl-tRNA(Gln) amidotransferase subunit A